MISGLPMPDAVTVLVSTELLAQLTDVWSPPVHISIVRTSGIGSGYEMTARTHTCPGQAQDAQYLRDALDVLREIGGGINDQATQRLRALADEIEQAATNGDDR